MLKKNLIINLIMTLIIGILAFVVNKYFSIYLGMEKLGLMNLFSQLLVYIALVETGIGAASTYALYKPLAEKNFDKVSIIISTITSIYNKIFFLIIILGLGVNLLLPFLLKGIDFKWEICVYWTLYVLSTGITYLFIKYVILFTADQKFGVVRLIQGSTKILCQILQILVIVKLKSFGIFICIIILSSLIEFWGYKKYYKKKYSYIYKTSKRDKSIGKNLKKLFCHKIGGLFVNNTDLIIISKFVSVDMVAIYASYQMIVNTANSLFNIVFRVIEPIIGKYIAEHTVDETFELWKKINVFFLFVSSIFSFCTYRLANDFILLWLGHDFILSNFTVMLISINLFVGLFRNITDIFKQSFGFFDDIHLPVLEAVINFILSIILVIYIGLDGVIIGTVFSNLIIICMAKPILVFRRCFKRTTYDYLKIYGKYVLLVSFSLFICNKLLIMINFDKIISWQGWIFKATLVLVIVFFSSTLVFLVDKEFRNIIYCKMHKE